MKKSRKLNARITPEVDRKLRELVRSTGSSMSDIIMKSIEHYFQQGAVQSNETPYEIAKRCKIIGYLRDGPSDLSTRYKEYLTEGLMQKHLGPKRGEA